MKFNSTIVYCLGVTCSGKTTFMEKAAEEFPDYVGLIQVGKEFRRRYPPEHFEGMAALKKTEVEALEIYNEQLALNYQKPIILVDGQPRMSSQIQYTFDVATRIKYILWFHVSSAILAQRIADRFGTDVSSAELAHQRLQNDRIQLYNVMYALLGRCPIIKASPNYAPIDLIRWLKVPT